jgi:integrase
VDLAYTYGWRVRDEVLTLARRHMDLDAGTIRLDPGATKNDDGRVVYLTPPLAATLAEQLERVRALERRLGRIVRGSSRTTWTAPAILWKFSPSMRHFFSPILG